MLTSNIIFKNFKNRKIKLGVKNIFNNIKKNYNNNTDLFILSLSSNYKNSFNSKDLRKYKKFKFFRLIGMGGSSLGAKAIYSFLKFKIKKNLNFLTILPYTI